MDAKWRFGATLVIWVFMGTISILALLASLEYDVSGWAFFTPIVLAMLSMLPLWASDSSFSSSSSPTKTGGYVKEEKYDNTAYSMALLMEMMDDDERDEFKHNLKNRILSGETVTDESLAEELQKRKSKPL